METLAPYIPYLGLFAAGFVGAATRGVAWRPTTALIQDIAGIMLIVILVNYLGDKITLKGQAAAIGSCCFIGAQKVVGLLANQIPFVKALIGNAKA